MTTASHSATTIIQALTWASASLRASSPTARLDAELVLAHVLGWSRARLLAERNMLLSEAALDAFQALIARRAKLEPVAYLLGQREFYGLEFFVDARVLVPRPETELLVELAIEWLRNHQPSILSDSQMEAETFTPSLERTHSLLTETQNSKLKTQNFFHHFVIADICTGSGCIAIALARHIPNAHIFASDISAQALELAACNVSRHDVAQQVSLLEGDLLEALPQPVDLLVSNPPYTIFDSIDEGVRLHEPRLALDGGPDGLDFYRKLLAAAPAKLKPGGAILLEIGAEQGQAVLTLARAAFPQANISLHCDLAGHDRVVRILCEPIYT